MNKFEIDDIVTRDGTDAHIVKDVYYYGYMVEVECIKEPEDKWIQLGEVECNFARRYKYAENN